MTNKITIESNDNVLFSMGEKVFFVNDSDKMGVVTAIMFCPTGVSYRVVWNDMIERWHYNFELSVDKVFTAK